MTRPAPLTLVGIVIATLRTVAEQVECAEDRRTLREIADQVEADPEGGLCCHVCEEVECDSGCPFEEARWDVVARPGPWVA